MRLLRFASLLVPLFLKGQTAPEPEYQDGLFAAGLPDNAPGITVEQKFKIYGHRFLPEIPLSLVTAGVRQIQNSPGQWGRGADGYGKRFGTDLARLAIANTVTIAVDSAFHLDPRFFRAPDGMSKGGRFKHALAQVVISHTDSGGRSFAFGSVLGSFAAGEAGTLWQPRRSDGRFGDGLVYAGFLFAGDAGRNLVREFWPDVRRKFRHNKP